MSEGPTTASAAPPVAAEAAALARPTPDTRLSGDRRRLAVVWALMLAWPLISPNDYVLSLGVAFLINLLLVASLNLAMGYTGLISLCHGAFFGLGAYISGVLSAKYGVSPWFGIVAGTLGTAAAATLIAVPTLRLRGHYLAMGTLGFNAILGVLFVELVPLTGGPNGLIGIEPFTIAGLSLDTPGRFFVFAWVICFVVMFVLLNLVTGPIGRNLRAIAGSEIVADTLGVDTVRLKIMLFSFSAAIAGLAGAFYAHFNLFASPETFGIFSSVLLVVMVALGGPGTYWGPFFGALIFTAVPELLRSLQDAELLIFGVCMVVVLLYFPGGVARSIGRRARGRREARDGTA